MINIKLSKVRSSLSIHEHSAQARGQKFAMSKCIAVPAGEAPSRRRQGGRECSFIAQKIFLFFLQNIVT